MKKVILSILLLSLITNLVASEQNGYENIPRKKERINTNWQWIKHHAETPSELNFEDANWKKVSIPHNPDPVSLWLNNIEDTWIQKESMRHINWYKKELPIVVNQDQKIFLEFEGVHTVTEVWVNRQFVGRYDISGYTPFHFDITSFVKSGEINEIIVKADNRLESTIAPDPHRTDYLKWGGIYRDVYLVTTNKLRVNFNWEDTNAGVHITTPTVKKRYGTASVKTTVVNSHSTTKNCTIITKIVNAEGFVLKTIESSKPIISGGSYTFKQTQGLEDADYHTWSPNQPYLYRAVSYIYANNELVDFVENKFGFRKLELVDGQGLLLNGEPFFMIGANRHQSFPHIGDAVSNTLHYEEALRYKEAGFNALRLSHYPQDNAFIDACDELGIVLYEEPATWIDWNQGEWMDKLEQSTRVMIRNHRNHPSIVIWGAGINHRGAVPRLAYAAKDEDPFRLTASGSSPWNGMRHAGPTDIFATMDYNMSNWAQEGFTLVMEHGSRASAAMNQYIISRYKKSKNNIGALAWVGADYYHLKPKKNEEEKFTEYGILDMYRNKKPVYYWYQSEQLQDYMVHIADERVSTNGIVHIYSNADRVELYANNKLVAAQTHDNLQEKQNNKFPSFSFYYNWQNEDLKAIAYKGKTVVATHNRKMANTPYALKLALEYPEIPLKSGGSEFKMLRASIVDKNGEVVKNAINKVHFEVSGKGALVLGEENYINEMQAMDGIATVYVKGTSEVGKINVKATSKSLKTSSISFETVNNETNEILENRSTIYDFERYNVDIGGTLQLAQFDWTAWNIESKDDFEFSVKDGVNFSVSSTNEIDWSKGDGSMIGDLCFMGADGVFVKNDPLTLSISGLEAGTYKIVTYHHARSHQKQFPYNINTVGEKKLSHDLISDQSMMSYKSANDIGERKPLSFTQFFKAEKNKEVKLNFKTDKENSYTWLNGFELIRIK